MTPEPLADYLPFVHPLVTEPVAEGISLLVPPEPALRSLARLGIVDTRGVPTEFSEDGTGTQPTPTLAHIALLDQTEAALINKSRGPLVGVG